MIHPVAAAVAAAAAFLRFSLHLDVFAAFLVIFWREIKLNARVMPGSMCCYDLIILKIVYIKAPGFDLPNPRPMPGPILRHNK